MWKRGRSNRLDFWQTNEAIWPIPWQRIKQLIRETIPNPKRACQVYWTNYVRVQFVVCCPFQLTGWCVSLLRAISNVSDKLMEMHFPGAATPSIGVSQSAATCRAATHATEHTLCGFPNMEIHLRHAPLNILSQLYVMLVLFKKCSCMCVCLRA